ncbi:MAG: hypothetical protein HRT58_01340 [Crocinitomicaceae bacterium]|nr:hypothetical protein [Flavobacteriales bacterium]NQZ34267.1 hypothetical protein [Crocinitomicaceae bacterium]
MKRNNSYLSILLIVASGFVFVNCKKYEFNDFYESDFLPVEETNSSVLFHYSSTTNANSGGAGYTQFSNYIDLYDSTNVLLTLTEGTVGGANNDTIFNANSAAAGILTTSSFEANFNSTIASAISLHSNKIVIANASYSLEFTDSKILIKTTTKFFQESTDEEYFLTPYILVDSIVADQTGHPDGPLTNHRKVAVDVGRMKNYPVRYLGYEVASGQIDPGYQFNLSFETNRLPSWTDTDKISVALILTKRDTAGNIVFVNANTNH